MINLFSQKIIIDIKIFILLPNRGLFNKDGTIELLISDKMARKLLLQKLAINSIRTGRFAVFASLQITQSFQLPNPLDPVHLAD
jgi:hypothetical protein